MYVFRCTGCGLRIYNRSSVYSFLCPVCEGKDFVRLDGEF